jgi:assimilatory nitrate reductase catalytic subunit
VVRVDQAVSPHAIRSELDILRGLASRFGVREHFDFHTGREVFTELCAVSRGGPADYSGMDWEALRSAGGIFWPAPRERPKGTRWLHLDRFATPDGRARFAAVTVSEPDSDAFPLLLITGRHRDHYLSGNQTRRIPKLLESAPEPVLEVHPDTAAVAGLIEGSPAHITSAQGSLSLAWTANAGLRRDTLFVPYHWPGINALTDDTTLDPVSRIPALKRTPVQLAPHVVMTATAPATLTVP